MKKLSPAFVLLSCTTFAPACTEESNPTGSCCRVCTTGKACGDSCISRDKSCNVGPGCACDG